MLSNHLAMLAKSFNNPAHICYGIPKHAVRKTYWTGKRIIFLLFIVYAFAVVVSLPIFIAEWFF